MKDMVLMDRDLYFKVLDVLEGNKEIRQQCYDTVINLYETDMGWIKGSLECYAELVTILPKKVKEYLSELASRISIDKD